MDITRLRPGISRVQATGEGKTSRFKDWRGIVTNVFSDQFVYVQFDHINTISTLLPDEVKLETHPNCPCGVCIHS